MIQKTVSLTVGLLMVLAGMALVWLASAGKVGRAAEVTGAPAAAGASTAPAAIVRVAAGRMLPYKDSQGNVWDADRGFEGGATVERPELKVTGTNEPGLYCAERYSMNSWSWTVPNGTYVVKLHFSESYESNKSPDDRIFAFEVQGQKFQDFSPGKKAGDLFKAYVETVKNVKVTDGQIKITFTPQVKPTQINAIEVYPASAADVVAAPSGTVGAGAVAAAGAGKAAAPKAVIRVAAGQDTPYKDSEGNTWAADTGFEGGTPLLRPELQVTGTKEPGLYCGEHYGMDSWSCKVPNGKYVVKLHFSEDYDGNADPNSRLFDYAVKDGDAASGKTVKKVAGFSPWAAGGAHSKAYVDTVPLEVTKGQITITFVTLADNSQINAIEVDAVEGGAEGAPATQAQPAAGAAGAAAGAKAILRMVAGRDAPFKDSQGNTWEADKGFEGGSTIDRPDLKVTGTNEPGIYQSEHYGMDSWSCKVPNGTYIVKLHFSEDYDGNADPDSRIFDFDVQGQKFKNFSPWKKAGAHSKAYIETVNVKVTDGQIKITFTPQVENPQINAIEIYSADAP